MVLPFLLGPISIELQIDFLGEFTKLRKATVSFVMSVCLSAVRLRENTWLPLDGFS